MDKRARKRFDYLKKKIDVIGNDSFSKMVTNPQGVLGEKLRELSLYKLSTREKGKFAKRVDTVNGGIKKMRTDLSLLGSSPYDDHRKTDRQNWLYITGPADLSDYYSYGGISFEYYPELFHIGFELYQTTKEHGYSVKDKIPKNMKEYKKVKEDYGDLLDTFEFGMDRFEERMSGVREEFYYYSDCDIDELGLKMEPTTWELYNLGWYVALAIECELEPGIMDSYPLEDAELLMQGIYCDVGMGEIGILGYVRYFLDFLIGKYKLNDDIGYKGLLPVLERVHFAALCPEEGNTLHAYVFSSENIKRYKDLKESNPDSEYVPVMDGLLKKLLDPLNIKEDSLGTSLVFEEQEVYYTSYYTDKEYVCAYLYFGSYVYGSVDWDDEYEEIERHGFHPFLLELRTVFDEMLMEYEKECLRNQKKREKKVS